QRRDPEMAGRLVRGVVPLLAPRLAGERRQKRPRGALVTAFEDPGSLHADEQPAVVRRERRHLRELPTRLLVVGKALARVCPGLAEVRAPPDGGPVPLARRCRVDRAAPGAVDRVIDGPALAERPAERPIPPVPALQQKASPAR